MEDIKKERFISNNHIPVSIERTEEILYQMKNSVCKIYKGGFIGTGFFCKVKLSNSKKNLYVLITNNHVLDENKIKLDSTFSLSIGDNDKQIKNIKISSDRKKYTNIDLDVTIIQINPEKDNISKQNFLEIDENANQDDESLKNIYEKKSIYLLGYPEGDKTKVSYGILTQLDKGRISHLCSTEDGSSGSPILLLENSKLIGIHFGCPKNSKFQFNYGTFIKYPYLDFLKDEEDTIISSQSKEELETDNSSFNNIGKDKEEDIFNKCEEKITDDNHKKYAKILFEVFLGLKEYEKTEKKNFSINIYENNIFKWEIKNEKIPLIMDFSNPPEYDLNKIAFIKFQKSSISLFELYEDIDININLEEEDINIIIRKIISFLEKINNLNIHTKKCLDLFCFIS